MWAIYEASVPESGISINAAKEQAELRRCQRPEVVEVVKLVFRCGKHIEIKVYHMHATDSQHAPINEIYAPPHRIEECGSVRCCFFVWLNSPSCSQPSHTGSRRRAVDTITTKTTTKNHSLSHSLWDWLTFCKVHLQERLRWWLGATGHRRDDWFLIGVGRVLF